MRIRLNAMAFQGYGIVMVMQETEQRFLSRIGEILLSLPFDLKVLQEAAADLDLERSARELAAGAILHVLSPRESEQGPLRFADGALLVRAALVRVAELGGDGAASFRQRFAEVYDGLDDDIRLFADALGDLWPWLAAKVDAFPKQVYKGKRAPNYVSDETALSFLYEQGLEFQTNYNVTEEQIRNKLRRVDQVVDLLVRRKIDEAHSRKL
jgi:hypothetical protein